MGETINNARALKGHRALYIFNRSSSVKASLPEPLLIDRARLLLRRAKHEGAQQR